MSTSAEKPDPIAGDEPPDGRGPRDPSADEEPVMAEELTSFLVEFGRLVQKHQVYPPGHPALSQTGLRSAEKAGEAMEALGEGREFRITVLREALEVEGEGATRPENRVCRTLAGRLHDRHAAALRVKRGVSAEEMQTLGRWLAGADAGDAAAGGGDGEHGDGAGAASPGGDGTGGRGAAAGEERPGREEGGVPEPPRLEHLVVELLPYDALRLRRSDLPPEDPDAGAEQIWRELAAAAHGREDPEELDEAELEAGAVGSALAERIRDPEVAGLVRTMARRVLRRSGSAPDGGGSGRWEYAGRLDRVLEGLDDDQLGELLGGERATEEEVRALILEAAPHLAPENLERLVRAADDHEYLEISDWLLRVLTKLVRHSRSEERGVRRAAERQVRQQVRDLVVEYHGDSPHTASYAAALRRMSRPDAGPGEHDLALAPPSARRLLAMGVEVDSETEPVLRAWEEHSRSRALRDLVTWLDESPDGGLTRRLRGEILDRGEPPLRSLLEEQPPATEAAAAVVDWSGEEAIPQLLEILAQAERRRVRRFAFDQLGALGAAVEGYALERLDDDRWYVRRNLLSLLARVSSPPFDLPLDRFLDDPHDSVRREAIRLGMLDEGWRDRALETALSSDERQTLTVGLAAALDGGYPESLAPRIAEIARDEDRSTEVRRRAVRALGASDGPAARDTLVRLVRRRDWPFFWRHRLRPTSGIVLEAISALGERWSGDPEAERVLGMARASDDPEVRDAAGAP